VQRLLLAAKCHLWCRSLSAAGAVECVVFAGLSREFARRMLGCASGGRHIKSLTYWITELTGTATLEGG